jgi:uncharacterized protein
MTSELVQLSIDKIMQTAAYTVIILACPKKKIAIFMEPSVGKNIQLFLTDTEMPRPPTHQLLDLMFKGLEVRVKQVVINQVYDTVYHARIFLEQQMGDIRHILEIDARPSDCITIALMNNAPIFCSAEVLEKVIGVEE